MASSCRGVLLVLAWLVGGTMAAWAQTAPAEGPPFLLSADQVIYDNQLGLVTARGRVEIASQGRVLLADTIAYSQRDGVVTANGNISLMEPGGEVIFAERLQLSDDLTEGFIESIRILLTDQSRFAANGARRFGENRTEMSKAVYSPCKLCPDHRGEAPLWQLKAARVIHHRDAQEIEYRDAMLEVYGFPVAYTPFFRHADPTAERKSGFLAPNLGSSSELGATFQVPYFWAIRPDRDLTFEPIVTSKEGVVLAGEYRALTATGGYQGYGSLTYTDKRNDLNEKQNDKEFRGHVNANGKFDIDNTWDWGFALARTTDDTYLGRYNFDDADTLTSELFLEGFRGRHYTSARMLSFQGLEADDRQGAIPFVAPRLDYAMTRELDRLPGRVHGDASAVSLYRTEGFDSRRLSINGDWQVPYVGSSGYIFTTTAALGLDLYFVNGFQEPGQPVNTSSNSGAEARAWPSLAMDWRFPWVRAEGTVRQVLEPVAQVVLAPYGGNPSEIPNEDSQSLEFDDTNLFSFNRFPGEDRVESGPRANLGLKASAFGAGGGYSTATVGQVFRVRDDDTFAGNTGLENHRSDYVLGLTVAPSAVFDLTNRLRLDRNDLSIRRNEIYLAMGPKFLRFGASYVLLERELTFDELDAREELYNFVRWRINENWLATGESRRDLRGGGSQIRTGAGLQYQDECIGFRLTFERSFTRDRDIQPSTSLNFRILLKHLG
ncbi:MAG: LPS assembly protein LptD [Alphaproteobacteria bacterium]|nr:LPS assembly protein LptD [Alphaproteobacteria bacterium]MDP6565263.1 LPS assembly protein LptD [Alphaproteobacteria bacterium]MDP6813404.1 LPS assembly protein LptD [Alphaproteobacteria bacterium]